MTTPSPNSTLNAQSPFAGRFGNIKAKRLKLSPVSERDLSTLIDLGLVEVRDDVPVLTNAGHAVLD